MTEEELQQIRERIAWRNSQFTVPHDQLPMSAHTDAEKLLTEVERLREKYDALLNVSTAASKSMDAKYAAMREIVQAVANALPLNDRLTLELVDKARAILADK